MKPVTLLNSTQLDLTLTRLAHELVENHPDFSNTVLIALQPRGIHVAERIREKLSNLVPNPISQGSLDITFFRDDFRRGNSPLQPSSTHIDFIIENKNVILIDDVLFTGRTIRAGLDAMLAFGRPRRVELLVLIDRRFSRHLPVQADYVGRTVDSIASQRVRVKWQQTDGIDQVELYTSSENQ